MICFDFIDTVIKNGTFKRDKGRPENLGIVYSLP